MDPVTNYRLGQIRQQELIDQAARDHVGDSLGAKSRIVALFERVRDLLRVDEQLVPQPKKARKPQRPQSRLVISR